MNFFAYLYSLRSFSVYNYITVAKIAATRKVFFFRSFNPAFCKEVLISYMMKVFFFNVLAMVYSTFDAILPPAWSESSKK